MMKFFICPLSKPVRVIAFVRFRNGRWESVRAHCRRLPRN